MAASGAPGSGGIYSATYSNVPVYEFNVAGNHVMRRRYDDFVNATHILKVAEYDKPARTRILEREVQKGHHEKVQGGYGKYQGTWIPLQDARLLAERNGVFEKLRPLFDYIPGNVSPPQAPKHTTNVNRTRAPKQTNAARKQSGAGNPTARESSLTQRTAMPTYSQMSDDYENASARLREEGSIDNGSTIGSPPSFLGADTDYAQPYMPGSKKRKRQEITDVLERRHVLYSDALLDYFILADTIHAENERANGGAPLPPDTYPRATGGAPLPPDTYPVDRSIDDQDHAAIHWAAAMGDMDVVKYLLDRGADIAVRNNRGETPLIRAVIFTNSADKNVMPRLINLLVNTILHQDDFGANVLHHIVMTTNSHAKRKCARHYLEISLNKLAEVCSPTEFTLAVNAQDGQGDTPLHIAVRHNAKKCVRALQGRGVRGDIQNAQGETADGMLLRSRAGHLDFVSSSPGLAHAELPNGQDIKPLARSSRHHYHTEAARSFSQSFEAVAQEKCMQVALAMDNELKQKDEDLAEINRMIEKAEAERAIIRQQTLAAIAESSGETAEEMRAMEEEEAQLIAEALSLSEQIQHQKLHRLISAAEAAIPPEDKDAFKNMTPEEKAAELEDRRVAALNLLGLQRKRRELTYKLVEAQASAGMTPTGEAMKRLVATLMKVPVDKVVELIPELLQELEQAKVDGAIGTVTAA